MVGGGVVGDSVLIARRWLFLVLPHRCYSCYGLLLVVAVVVVVVGGGGSSCCCCWGVVVVVVVVVAVVVVGGGGGGVGVGGGGCVFVTSISRIVSEEGPRMMAAMYFQHSECFSSLMSHKRLKPPSNTITKHNTTQHNTTQHNTP